MIKSQIYFLILSKYLGSFHCDVVRQAPAIDLGHSA